MSTATIYGNLGFNTDGNLYAISGSGDFRPSFDGVGIYTVEFDVPFDNTPTVTITQIWNGSLDTTNKLDDFTYDGGDVRDNAVMIAVDEKHCRFCVGSGNNGAKQNRMVGFIAVGPCD